MTSDRGGSESRSQLYRFSFPLNYIDFCAYDSFSMYGFLVSVNVNL